MVGSYGLKSFTYSYHNSFTGVNYIAEQVRLLSKLWGLMYKLNLCFIKLDIMAFMNILELKLQSSIYCHKLRDYIIIHIYIGT